MRVERNWHPCQSDPHRGATPLNSFTSSSLGIALCSAQTKLISGIRHPTYPDTGSPRLHFQIARPGGVYIIFSAASPTAQWAVHRSITRSVHPWPCPQPQRSRLRSERPETTLDHCRLLDASYAVVMSWNMERTIMGRADCACVQKCASSISYYGKTLEIGLFFGAIFGLAHKKWAA